MDNSQAQTYVKEKRSKTSGLSSKVQRLGRGLMLPIAILPIAGLLLGVGAAINNSLAAFEVSSSSAYFIGYVMQDIGNVVFANLPVLFAIAIAITFTDDAGGAALSAFVGFLIFNAVQTPFIGETYIQDGQSFVDIAFYTGISASLFTNNLGIYSLSTSVFGGIIIGMITAYLYNKYHKIKLPTVIGFFGGIRFVPIVTILYSTILGLIFILVWPVISIGITEFGSAVTGLPFGLNSLFFGITERALIPFGLHHVFYTPLWYSSAGAILDPSLITVNGGLTLAEMTSTVGTIDGDQSIWIFLNSNGVVGFDDIAYMAQNATGGSMPAADSVYDYNLTWTEGAITSGYAPAQYLQGKFTIMIFGLPAAGAAMVMAAKKENREVAMSIIGAAALTSFLTGITEPIEFTFLFLAPLLFYGFHVPMAGISFWVLNVAGANVGLTFSGGLFDLLIYGLLPSITGNGTQFWIIIVLGVVYIPIYYFVFYYYITVKDIPTPGRTNDQVKMITKDEYRNRNKGEIPSDVGDEEPTRVEELIINLGGLDNLKTIDACATRLRLTVENRDLINEPGLKAMGAAGVGGKGLNVQVIFGGEADILKSHLKEVRSGKQKVDDKLIQEQIALINGLTPLEEVQFEQPVTIEKEDSNVEEETKSDSKEETQEIEIKVDVEETLKPIEEAQELAKEETLEPAKEETSKTEVKDFADTKENFNTNEEVQTSEEDKELANNVIEYLGQASNIVKVTGNITRLSIKVNDRKLIDEEKLRSLDIKDIVGHSNNFQIVWNTEVDNLAKAINEQLK